jgi:membrane-associated phospholipid phosphatase
MVVPFVLAYLVGAEIKDHVTAYRPSPEFGVEGPGGGRSFPSGHVAWAVLFWGFLATLLSRGLSRRDRWMVLTVVVILVGATALGRVHLGRHWPLDTLAGALIGLAGLRVMVFIHGLLESFTARAGAGAVAGWRDPGYAPLRETTDRSTR